MQNDCAKVSRVSQIVNVCEKLEKEITINEEKINVLYERFSPILDIKPQPPDKKESSESPSYVPLANRIYIMVRKVEHNNLLLQQLIDSCEL